MQIVEQLVSSLTRGVGIPSWTLRLSRGFDASVGPAFFFSVFGLFVALHMDMVVLGCSVHATWLLVQG